MGQTNREAYLKAKKLLSLNKRIEFSDSEIYLLLIKANQYKNFTELIINFDENLLNPDQFSRNLARLNAGEPIQYVTGEAPFFDMDLRVNNNVLIPRPETEGLCNIVKEEIQKYNLPHSKIGDICTGSGCIAAFLKRTFIDSTVYATDKYVDAMSVAEHNFQKYHLDIITLIGSRVNPFLDRNLKLDVLVSNPPYVENMDDIEPIVLNYEPMHAVYVRDGTKFYESYFKHHREVMNDKFLMAFEINYDQEEKLTFLIKHYFDLNKIEYKFIPDVFGLTRYLVIKGDYSENR